MDAQHQKEPGELVQPIAEAEEILAYLTAVMRGQPPPFPMEGSGSAASERERAKAAELLGRHYGLFSDRAAADVPVPIIVDDIADAKEGF